MLYNRYCKYLFLIIALGLSFERRLGMKARIGISLIAVLVSLVLLFCSDKDGTSDPLSGDPANNNGTNGTTLDPTMGVGPTFIPTGESKTGTSGLEDGSAARLLLYGDPQYFWGDPGNGTNIPLVEINHAVSSQVVDMQITFNPGFVDNSYGTGSSVGWPEKRGHTFRDLYVSDHVEIKVLNGAGEVVFYGRLDLLSPDSTAPSGYASLGPWGGDGVLYEGDPKAILSFGTTLDDNMNYYGYHLYENSPATDSNYTTNPQYPNWQFYVSYHLTLDAAAFGPSGYGKCEMTSVHASPAKTPNQTINVTEGPAPTPGSSGDPFRFYNPPKVAPPDTSTVPPDTGSVPPDTGNVPPDTGNVPPDTGSVPPDTGTVPPDTGNVPPDTGSIPPDTGGGVD